MTRHACPECLCLFLFSPIRSRKLPASARHSVTFTAHSLLSCCHTVGFTPVRPCSWLVIAVRNAARPASSTLGESQKYLCGEEDARGAVFVPDFPWLLGYPHSEGSEGRGQRRPP
jgi:hypothetical protein